MGFIDDLSGLGSKAVREIGRFNPLDSDNSGLNRAIGTVGIGLAANNYNNSGDIFSSEGNQANLWGKPTPGSTGTSADRYKAFQQTPEYADAMVNRAGMQGTGVTSGMAKDAISNSSNPWYSGALKATKGGLAAAGTAIKDNPELSAALIQTVPALKQIKSTEDQANQARADYMALKAQEDARRGQAESNMYSGFTGSGLA